MRWLLILIAARAFSHSFDISPAVIHQGETLKLSADSNADSARFLDRTIRLFPAENGRCFGLMPVPVLEKPGQYPLEFLDSNGVVLQRTMILVRNAHYGKQNIVIAKSLSELRPSPGERETVNAFRHEVTPVRFWQEPLESPVPGCMTSPFGVMRLHNGKPTGDFHAGIDQRAPAASPIHAIAAGDVKIVRPFNLRGGTVAIDHGQGLQSIYLHLSSFAIKEGDHVARGDVIGYAGSTGRSTAPHLHWTLYVQSEPVNPSQWVHLVPCREPPKAPAAPHAPAP
ncbi:MAG: M23 family metallopeptidase [Acidobacteriaceae bacterium]|nr:M23 family metallopeptidase [Acidobacteriaceae bacterium]MBV8570883.1 M23 family metallopeptidase [Acidobacteriaceae bacterium]